jgi:uncharacterized protein
MLKRKIYQSLLKWKTESQGQSALLIEGARRVGKSFIIQEFVKEEYQSAVIIDFSNISGEVRDIFLHETQNLDFFFQKLSAYYGSRLHDRQSAIIFDEVQLLPQARQLIKHLVADGRYDYLETGSLLSLRQNTDSILIPSEEEHLKMYPMDFEEFLWAMGEEPLYTLIRECFEASKPLGPALHRKAMNLFRQYIITGGMPQVVSEYVLSKDFAKADRIKRRILTLYRADASRFAKGYESKVLSIFDEIPSQLLKKEKRFSLNSLSKEARYRQYEDAFVWLKEAMIVNMAVNATDPHVGLKAYEDRMTFKCYFADTGLLVTQVLADKTETGHELYKSMLFDKLEMNEGMFFENAVAQMLAASGHEGYFYSRTDRENAVNTMEVDFLIQRKSKISPIEVKSSAYLQHSSLNKFNAKFQRGLGTSYIVYTKDYMVKDGIHHIPAYMAGLL